MRGIPTLRVLRFCLFLLGIGVLSGFLVTLNAYNTYENSDDLPPDDPNFRTSNNCFSCHEKTAIDTLPEGFDGRKALHSEHLNKATSDCGNCHTGNNNNPRFIGSSDLGEGCIGCHGQPTRHACENNGAACTSDAECDPGFRCLGFDSTGAGLRLHHTRANVGPDLDGNVCFTCHTEGGIAGPDPAPRPESVLPTNYQLNIEREVDQTDPCNSDFLESFWDRLTGQDFVGPGLDNDGDMRKDGLDPDCGLVPFDVENLGFNDALDPQLVTWNTQGQNNVFDLIRGDNAQFAASPLTTCLLVGANTTSFDDTEPVPLGGVLFYLARNTLAADWGMTSAYALRLYNVCP